MIVDRLKAKVRNTELVACVGCPLAYSKGQNYENDKQSYKFLENKLYNYEIYKNTTKTLKKRHSDKRITNDYKMHL